MERSNGIDDSRRTLAILEFSARLSCTKKREVRSVAILYDRILRVEYVENKSITLVFLNYLGIERSVTFVKNDLKEVNLIYAA